MTTFVGEYTRCYHAPSGKRMACGAQHDHILKRGASTTWHWRGRHWHIECIADQLASELEEHLASWPASDDAVKIGVSLTGEAANEEGI